MVPGSKTILNYIRTWYLFSTNVIWRVRCQFRAHWVTYALGTVATSIVGTKDVGALTKLGVTNTKVVVPKIDTTTNNASASFANLLPYAPCPQFSMVGEISYNVVNATGLKN
jgi:hypothetical protein